MHKAKAVVITCMDFRFHNKIQEYLLDKGYLGHCDEIVIAGASRDFIKPLKKEHGDYVWRELELSIKLHNPDEIIFIDHQDCGGYAQDSLIKGGLPVDADKNEHIAMLVPLKSELAKRFPGKAVKFIYAELAGDIYEINP